MPVNVNQLSNNRALELRDAESPNFSVLYFLAGAKLRRLFIRFH